MDNLCDFNNDHHLFPIHHIYHVVQRYISTHELRIYNKITIVTAQDSNAYIAI